MINFMRLYFINQCYVLGAKRCNLLFGIFFCYFLMNLWLDIIP